MEKETFTARPAAFVATMIARVKTDTGCRAALRRADNPATESYAWEYLVSYCRLDNDRERKVFAVVGAALARAVPDADGRLDLGAALRKIAPGEDEKKTELGRLRRLIACDRNEILNIVPGVVRYLESKGAAISYERLLNDLIYWEEAVKIRWTKNFFHREAEADEKEVTP